MFHEAQLHDHNSFLTLTYDDSHLPEDGSVSVRETQLFFKRLRERLSGDRLRYFCVGEYGEARWRPHYHAIVFGFDFPDKYLFARSPAGNLLYRSPLLEEVWPFGQSLVGDVTHKSAGYVARYCFKKVTGERSDVHYVRPHPVTGQFFRVLPEFARMSRRPGIGNAWLSQFASDCYPSDFIVVDGKRRAVPRYYQRALDDRGLLARSQRSKSAVRKDKPNRTDRRLATRDEINSIRASKLIRDNPEAMK